MSSKPRSGAVVGPGMVRLAAGGASRGLAAPFELQPSSSQSCPDDAWDL